MVSDFRIRHCLEKCYPDIYQDIIGRRILSAIPTRKEIDYLLHRSSHYNENANAVFIAAFVHVFDPFALQFDITLKRGMRELISREIHISPHCVSKLLTKVKVWYKFMPSFKSRIDEIVNDLKNMELNAAK